MRYQFQESSRGARRCASCSEADSDVEFLIDFKKDSKWNLFNLHSDCNKCLVNEKKLIYLWPCRLFCKTSSSSSRCRCFVCDKHLMKLIVDRAWRGQFEENYARIIKTEAERNMFREASSTIGVRAPRIEFQSKGMFPISLRIVTIFSVTSRRAVWVRIFWISIYRRSQHQTILHLSRLGDKRSWESFSCREK